MAMRTIESSNGLKTSKRLFNYYKRVGREWNPPVFKPVNPGLCAGKNPGLTGLISGVSILRRKACRYGKQLICGKISETIKIIKCEMAVFGCSGVRGRILYLYSWCRPTQYSYLQSIPHIGRSGARFLRCRDTLYKDSFAPLWRYAAYAGYFVLCA